jgi:UDP-N-acetylglucosamine:LPS N-acetylglucosamine transferase
MAVCSGGGHWIEMQRLLPAFEGSAVDLVFVSTHDAADAGQTDRPYYRIRNATRRDRLAFAVLAVQLTRILRKERPEVVVTTGAAPGLVALALARWLCGSRTVWIDSIAAAERLSMSGRHAGRVADAWLTQWEHLARPGGPHYWGAVL